MIRNSRGTRSGGYSARRAAALLMVVALVATGCSLQAGRAGAKCAKVGSFASDGVYVLKCNARKRWQRGITIALGQQLLAAAIAANTPRTTVAPPITSFGAFDGPVGTGPGQVKPGLYTTVGDGCSWGRYDAADRLLGSNSFSGRDFALIRPTDVSFASFGPCSWVEAPAGAQSIPASGNATQRVGVEIQPGFYRSAGTTTGTKCFWARESSMDGSFASLTNVNASHGPQIVQVKLTDVAFESRNCPPFTAFAGPPAQFAAISGQTDELITSGQDATYALPFDAVTVTGTAAEITAQFGGYALQLRPPTGGALAAGNEFQGVGSSSTATAASMTLSSSPRTCATTTVASFTIIGVTYGGGGAVTSLTALAQQVCDLSGKVATVLVKF